MQKRSLSLSILAILGVSAATMFGSSAAFAEVADDVDAVIVEATSDYLGVDPLSPELTQKLVEGVDAATDAEIVNSDVVNEAVALAGDEQTSEVATESEVGNTRLDGLLEAQLEGDQQLWDAAGPAWVEAFETLRSDFELCRTDGSSTSECARTFAFSLQVAHAENALTTLDNRIADVSLLPEEEQADALAELEEERASIEARLVRAEARLASVPQDVSSPQAGRLLAALSAARERASVTQGIDVAQQSASPSGQAPASAPQNGNQNVPTPQKPETPNANPNQGSANSGSSSQGNRPQNTGKPENAGNSSNARP